MVVLVASRMRQALARSTLYSNVVGDSMLARLRNSTIALLGVVTVVGLALVAFISQLGIPGAFDGAIPNGPRDVAAVGKAIALTPAVATGHPAPGNGRKGVRYRSSAPTRPPAAAPGPGSGTGLDLGGSKQAGHAPQSATQPPSEHAQPPEEQAPSAPATEPTAEQAPTESTPASVAGPKTESSAEPQKPSPAEPKSSGHSQGKAKGQTDETADTASSGESKTHHSGGSGHHSYAPSKPSYAPPKSAHGSAGKAPEPGSAPPEPSGSSPSSEPVEKGPPEAGGKETGHPGKSDKPHH